MTSVLGSALGGLVAGVVGTVAMDLVWFARYKRTGGEEGLIDWEFASSVTSWDAASAPARVGKLLFETASRRELPATRAALTTNAMHWGYGAQWGVAFGVAVGCGLRMRAWHAPLFGLLVWLSSYVSLPVAGVYKPIWSYDLKTLWEDLSAHLAYGAGVAAAFFAVRRSCTAE